MGATLGRASPPGRARSGRGEGSRRRARRVHRPARRAVRPGRARRGGRVRPGPPRGRVRARSSTWRDATGPRGAVRPSSPIPPREGGAPIPDRGRTLPAPPRAKDERPMSNRVVAAVERLGQGPERAASSAPRPAPARHPLHRVAQERLLGPRPPPPAHRSLPVARPHTAHCGYLVESAARRQGRSCDCARPGRDVLRGTVRFSYARHVYRCSTTRFPYARYVFRRPGRHPGRNRPIRPKPSHCARSRTVRFSCARHVYLCSTVRFRKTYLARGPSNSRGPGALQGRRSLA